MISALQDEKSFEILFEALGHDLKWVQKKFCAYNKFSVPTCYMIAIQVLDLLHKLHSVNIVHNDIKLENILIGKIEPSKIYLIDFGLA